MKTIYKCKFHTPVHFGTPTGLLSDSAHTLNADTLFSAILQEALKFYGETGLSALVQAVRENQLRITDAFPYVDEQYFVPTPLIQNPPFFSESSVRKKYKKLSYIPASELTNYLQLTDDLESHQRIDGLKMLENSFGKSNLRTSVNLQFEDDALPYSVFSWHYGEEAGLYFIADTTSTTLQEQLHTLITSIGYSGIGGKRNVGYGKFEVDDPIDLSDPYVDDLDVLNETTDSTKTFKRYMSLSCSLPLEEEMEETLKTANYNVIRRGGFTDSTAYAGRWLRKQDIYFLKSGSVFEKAFEGDIYDVSNHGLHAIYRYAKPVFMGVAI